MPTPEEIAKIKAKPEAERTKEDSDALAAAERSTGTEHMIPKSRLDEVIAARDRAEAEAAKLKKEQEDAKADALAKQGEWKQLAEQREQELKAAKLEAGKVTEYEKTLKETLEAQLKEIPEAMRALVPSELTTQQQLGWLARNRALLVKPAAQDIGAGRRGGHKDDKGPDLSDDIVKAAKEYGMTPEEYADFQKGTPDEPFNKSKSKQTQSAEA